MIGLVVLLSVALLMGSASGSAEAGASQDLRSFPVQPGDTAIIQNDYGQVRVAAWDEPGLQVGIRKRPGRKGPVQCNVLAEKRGDKIFVYAFFTDNPGESVDLDIKAPAYVGAVVWGANPDVEVRALQGPVRVHTLTGGIVAEDLTGSASLLSEHGDISFRCHRQPKGDVRLETLDGGVYCELGDMLNARCWFRGAGGVSLAGEPPGEQLEKQFGTGGPLIYAASLRGKVRAEVKAKPKEAEPAPAAPVKSPAEPVREPAAAPPPVRQPSTASADRPIPASASGKAASAEVQPTIGSEGNPTFKVKVDWVFLNASVRDRYSNRSIPNLEQRDFEIYEDGVMQEVGHFENAEAPFHLLLLLDISGSTAGFIDLSKEASIRFTGEINANDRIAVAAFNSDVDLIQPFTNNRNEVAASIRRLRSGGGTAFYDALLESLEGYMRGVAGRKAIVVFTDGVDNQLMGSRTEGSRATYGALFRRIQEVDTLIYPIFLNTEDRNITGAPPGSTGGIGGVLGDIIWGRRGTGNWPVPAPGGSRGVAAYREARQQLQDIADQTGGRMYAPEAIQDLSRVYSEIADDLRVQYWLGYSSSNTNMDGSWRDIRVKVRNHKDAVVRTRKGYYARSNQGGQRQRTSLTP